jgi:hypothetical protein
MENTVIISDHAQMDRAIKEERQYILNIIIKKSKKQIAMYYLYKNQFYVERKNVRLFKTIKLKNRIF